MKTKVYLLHGWGFDERVWKGVIEDLDHIFEPETLDVWSLIGAADEQPEICLSRISKQLRREYEADAIWVCWSMSTLLGLRLMCSSPEFCKGLIILAGTPCFLQKFDWGLAITNPVFEDFRLNLAANAQKTMKRFCNILSVNEKEPAAHASRLKELLCKPDLEKELHKGLSLMSIADERGAMRANREKIKWVIGSEDSLLMPDVECAKKILGKDGVQVINEAGHCLPLTHAREITRIIGSSF